MSITQIEQSLRQGISSQVRLVAEGTQRYRVLTPFLFDDGDHVSLLMRREDSRWVVADEANTFMRLTYDLEERAIQEGTRQKLIACALSSFGVENRGGELRTEVVDDGFAGAVLSMIQAILRVSDVSYLAREHVRSTFMDDFRSLLETSLPDERRDFDWHDPHRDPQAVYTVDCRINGMPRPVFVHALAGDNNTRDATIALHQFENWGLSFLPVAVFEDQEGIGRKVLARFSDVGGKQFSSLRGNEDRISGFLQQLVE